jgi:GNAT superfamily N-acetyltransferase
MLRPGRDGDAEGFVRLIADCWSEYPGCIMDLDGENPELRALASYFASHGGALWAAEDADEIVGMVGTHPLEAPGEWELCRMYVAARLRGTGLAHRLADAVEDHARAAGGRMLRLWSDTRFSRAHRFYERRGFVRGDEIRALHDVSNTLEYEFWKRIDP